MLLALLAAAPGTAQSLPHPHLTLDLRIDGAAADLSEVDGMLVARNGDILLPQWQDRTIRVFSSTGVPSTFGHAGEGPGEFRNLRLAGLHADSVWVEDPMLERVTIFSPQHKFVRSFRFPRNVFTPSTMSGVPAVLRNVSPDAIYSDGSIRLNVGVETPGTPPADWSVGIAGNTMAVLRTGEDGTLRTRIAIVPEFLDCRVEIGGAGFHIPFCAEPINSLYSGSTMFVTVQLDRGATGLPSYSVTSVDENGKVAFARSYSFIPVRVPKAVADSALAFHRKRFARNPAMLDALAKVKLPVTFPPVRAMIVGRDGTIWIDERVPTGHQWKILDRAGNPIGVVNLPESISLCVADRTALWGLETDADGLQGIVRYQLSGWR